MTPDEKLSEQLRVAKGAKDFFRALGEYYEHADAAAANCETLSGGGLACRKDCAFCCHLPVGVRAYEVLLLVDFIRSHFSSNEQQELISRLRQHELTVSPMTRAEQEIAGLSCPLLAGSYCSVYSVRPFSCRSYHSLDVSACQKFFNDPKNAPNNRPMLEDLDSGWKMAIECAGVAYLENGYDLTFYELGSALLAALTDSATAKRSREKKKTFPQARNIGI